MKLHKLKPHEHLGPPCGCVALSILNGKTPHENLRDILAFRKTKKPYRDEYIYNRDRFYIDTSIIYFREILHFFSPFFHPNSEIIWVKRKNRVCDFFHLLNPKHTYLVASTIHLQVIKNEKIWDTSGIDIPMESNEFNREYVKWFVRLK